MGTRGGVRHPRGIVPATWPIDSVEGERARFVQSRLTLRSRNAVGQQTRAYRKRRPTITFIYSVFGKTTASRTSPSGHSAHGHNDPLTRCTHSPTSRVVLPGPSGGNTLRTFGRRKGPTRLTRIVTLCGTQLSTCSWLRIHRISESMNSSISPSRTAAVLPVSAPVRTSLTLWYGCST